MTGYRMSLAVGTTVLALAAGCEKKTPPAQPLRPVRTLQVTKNNALLSRTYSGVAQAGLEADLSFKVAGNVTRIAVKVGDVVQKDQLVAELDREAFELKLEIAQASLQQAQAQARNAEANYKRVEQLWENSNASRSDLDVAQANSETAKAQVQTASKQLELANLELSYTQLRCPYAGAVADVLVEVNENLRAGQTVAKLASDSEIEVKASIPEAQITSIHQGDGVQVRFDAVPGVAFAARVTEVGVRPTETVTTFPVTVRLTETQDRLRSGMAAEVTFQIRSGDGSNIVVPAVAVGQDRGGRYVFVVEPGAAGEGIVRRRSVEIGDLTEAGLAILEGLTTGDRVVTAGVSRITDGQRVRLDAGDASL